MVITSFRVQEERFDYPESTRSIFLEQAKVLEPALNCGEQSSVCLTNRFSCIRAEDGGVLHASAPANVRPLASLAPPFVFGKSSLEGLHVVADEDLVVRLEYRSEAHVCVVQEAVTRVDRAVVVDGDELVAVPKIRALSERTTQQEINNASDVSDLETRVVESKPHLED